MKIEVDSTNKKLIIKELPNAEIKIFSDAEISSLDDSFNRFSQEDFKRITTNAKKMQKKYRPTQTKKRKQKLDEKSK
jgi:hypothetical protein